MVLVQFCAHGPNPPFGRHSLISVTIDYWGLLLQSTAQVFAILAHVWVLKVKPNTGKKKKKKKKITLHIKYHVCGAPSRGHNMK